MVPGAPGSAAAYGAAGEGVPRLVDAVRQDEWSTTPATRSRFSAQKTRTGRGRVFQAHWGRECRHGGTWPALVHDHPRVANRVSGRPEPAARPWAHGVHRPCTQRPRPGPLPAGQPRAPGVKLGRRVSKLVPGADRATTEGNPLA